MSEVKSKQGRVRGKAKIYSNTGEEKGGFEFSTLVDPDELDELLKNLYVDEAQYGRNSRNSDT